MNAHPTEIKCATCSQPAKFVGTASGVPKYICLNNHVTSGAAVPPPKVNPQRGEF
jgi:hypothetical protein